jgi:hypothetical protein
VAGCCKCGAEPSGSGVTELVRECLLALSSSGCNPEEGSCGHENGKSLFIKAGNLLAS